MLLRQLLIEAENCTACDFHHLAANAAFYQSPVVHQQDIWLISEQHAIQLPQFAGICHELSINNLF